MIRIEKVSFSYSTDFSLEIDHLEIDQGSRVAITGASGCGKTTFIKLLAGILQPDSGRIIIDDLDITAYSTSDLQDLRIVKCGLVFQEFELLDYLRIMDNVTLPLRINPVVKYTKAHEMLSLELLDNVGLGSKSNRYPAKLSQGERQRVAVCRALITSPKVLLCDEPTANLDSRNRDAILKLIFNYCETHQATLIMVTHDRQVLENFDREIELSRYHTSKTNSTHE